MIVDGRGIATSIYEEIHEMRRGRTHPPRLTIITCAPNFETKKYLALKEKKAGEVGIQTNVIELSDNATTEEVISRIHAELDSSDGIVVQLPLPDAVNTSEVVSQIPPTHDVDALNPKTNAVVSPVIGACRTILAHYNVEVAHVHVVVVGNGRLVGVPAQKWFASQGAEITTITKDTINISQYTRTADIIVCGAGVPGLITPDIIKDGVVILDAGTSEEGGVLRGDADPKCAEKASLFTPVPGGIGPVTIAVLLRNLVVLSA